jgi:hypothetical protein
MLLFQGNSFAINAVKGTKLEITNSCFLGNNFAGRGMVLVDVAETITESGNYGTHDDNLDCQFINIGGVSCIEFSSSTCLAEKYRSLMLPSSEATQSAEAPQSADMPIVSTGAQQSKSSWVVVILSFVFVGALMFLVAMSAQ